MCGPTWTRTRDPPVMSRELSPTELWAHPFTLYVNLEILYNYFLFVKLLFHLATMILNGLGRIRIRIEYGLLRI